MTYLIEVSENRVISTSAKMQQSIKTLMNNNVIFGFTMGMRAEYAGTNSGNIQLSGKISSRHKFKILPAMTAGKKTITLNGIVDNTDSGLSSFDILEKIFSFRITDADQTEIAHWDNPTNRETFGIALETQKEYFLESNITMELLWQTNPLDADVQAEIYFLEVIEP